MKAYYQNWQIHSLYIPHLHKWYRVNELMNYLQKLRSYFLEGANLPNNLINHEIPIAEYERFPSDTSYMCEGIGEWNVHFDKLQLCLSILRRSKRLDESIFETIGEVEMFALERINLLMRCIAQESNLLTRDKFEKMYGLEWVVNNGFVDYHAMPVLIVGILQRVDKLWHIVARTI